MQPLISLGKGTDFSCPHLIAEVGGEAKDQSFFMSTPDQWFTTYFTEDEIQEMKSLDAQKQSVLRGDRLVVAHDTKWSGLAGEECFKKFLESYGATEGCEFIHHWKKLDYDDLDFTYIAATSPDKHIDVKTTFSAYLPRRDWMVNVTESQVQKMLKPGCPIDTLVFCRFKSPDTCVFVGWMPFESFYGQATFLPAGTKSGRIVMNTDCRSIEIERLIKPESIL